MPNAKKKGVFFAVLVLFAINILRSEEHTSELQSQSNLVCRLLLEKKDIHVRLLGIVCASLFWVSDFVCSAFAGVLLTQVAVLLVVPGAEATAAGFYTMQRWSLSWL